MAGDFTFLKGNVETIILSALYGGDKYGYEIAREIKERTENQYEIKQPTLYSYLKRLEGEGLILSYWGTESNGGRRRYYTLTDEGKKDCESFLAEWKYQKNVMENLVTDASVDISLTQSQVTPLFGTKQRKPRVKKHVAEDNQAEQDEIARRLSELAAATSTTDDEPDTREKTSMDGDVDMAENVSGNHDEGYFDEDSDVAVPGIAINYAIDADAAGAAYARDIDGANPTQQSFLGLFPDDSEDANQSQNDEVKAKFEVNQQNAEEFIEEFDKKAEELNLRSPSEADEGENYQHVLMSFIGDQLAEMENVDSQQKSDFETSFASTRSVVLEDVADDFARQGVRMRIYNRTTAVYHSKALVPMNKILCQTSWLTYASIFALLLILALTSIKSGVWSTFVIFAGVLLVVPIAFTVVMLVDKTRKDKPPFVFKTYVIGAIIIAGVVTFLSFGINILSNIHFAEFGQVATRILLPTSIGLGAPLAVVYFNLIISKYE